MLFATGIFVLGLLTLAISYQYIATQTARDRSRLVGQFLAKGLMEKCIAARYTNVVNLASKGDILQSTNTSPADYPPVQTTFRKNGQAITVNYYSEVTVNQSKDPLFTAGNTNARVVVVRVSWELQNRPFAEYRTLIGENS
jgi:uncharacterized protein YjiK